MRGCPKCGREEKCVRWNQVCSVCAAEIKERRRTAVEKWPPQPRPDPPPSEDMQIAQRMAGFGTK